MRLYVVVKKPEVSRRTWPTDPAKQGLQGPTETEAEITTSMGLCHVLCIYFLVVVFIKR